MNTNPSAQDLLDRLLQAPDARNLSSDLLREAEQLFRSRGDAVRARWMELEHKGYGERTEAADLDELLGPGAPPEVLEAVLRGRRRLGRVVIDSVERSWPHFFVESVEELRRWEERVSGGGALTISVELSVPAGARGPRALTFPRGIFGNVLYAIALEVGSALQALADFR